MEDRTVWRLTEVPTRRGIELELVVDTQAPAVVEAIEQAARENGVVIERVADEA